MDKDKAIEIVENLTNTINNMGDKEQVVSQSSAFKPTRASKSRLKRIREKLIKKYKL